LLKNFNNNARYFVNQIKKDTEPDHREREREKRSDRRREREREREKGRQGQRHCSEA